MNCGRYCMIAIGNCLSSVDFPIPILLFEQHALPIHAFYALEAVSGDAGIGIEEIRGFKKFDTLMPNYLYTFSYLKPGRLKYLSRMLNTVRVFKVTVPWDLERIGEVHEAICRHSGAIE